MSVKKVARPALRREAVHYILDHRALSRRLACRVVRQHRSVQTYVSRKDPRTELRARMRDIAQTRVRYGYRRIRVLLRRERWTAGKDQVYRLYRHEGLQLPAKRPRRRKMAVTRRERVLPRTPGVAWAMDFVIDQLTSGQRFRALAVIDVFTG